VQLKKERKKMRKIVLVDENCVNEGDCSTCEKKETCTNVEVQEFVNRALQAFKEKPQS